MMYLRDYDGVDLVLVDGFWEKHHKNGFNLPSMKNVIESKVIVKDGRVVGFGMVKLFAEGIIILNKDEKAPTLAKAVQLGIDHALGVTGRAGLEQFHVFTDDPHYVEVLKKHWGFRTAPETVLYREIERG